jgi:hypothetical protein
MDRRTRLRPMRSNEIIDLSLSTYQSIGWTLLKACAVPSVFCYAAFVFVTAHVLPNFAKTSDPTSITTQLTEAVITLAIALGIGAPIFFIGISYASAVVCQMVSEFITGSTPNLETARKVARKNLLNMATLSVKQVLLSCSGLVLGLLGLMLSAWLTDLFPNSNSPAIITVVSIIFLILGIFIFPVALGINAIAMPTCVIEGLKSKEAGKRGRELLKAGPYQPSGYDTVTSLLAMVAILILLLLGGLMMALSMLPIESWLDNSTILGPVKSVLENLISTLPVYFTIWTLVPVWGTTTTILYLERRIRIEGYDIEALAKDVWRADRQSRFEY